MTSGELEEISPDECWRLLAGERVGRLAVVMGHYPLVFPVNYTLDGRHIVFRTGVGTKLWSIQRSNVSFEVDDFDPDSESGWSVLARGVAHEVKSSNAAPEPWAPGVREHLVSVVVDSISGRRISKATTTEERPTTA
ncbi:MAG: pyridoxamine 5'-phosphate oxidase family protein [Acidimicrobiaceae bacterium]|nr:pyridoxamine 5'-phosphate oxidase family protein [Acidimicrobiaceae bacterium]